jgi:hypothetical protein
MPKVLSANFLAITNSLDKVLLVDLNSIFCMTPQVKIRRNQIR